MPYDKQGIFQASNKPIRRNIKAYTPKVVQKAVKDYVKGAVNRMNETKLKVVKATYADLESASQRIIPLTTIINEGTGNDGRNGTSIEPLRIKAKVAVKATAPTTNPYVVRVMLIKAKQMDGTAPTLANILPDASGDIKYLAVDQALVDTAGVSLTQQKHKFQILYDKTKVISYTTADSSNGLKIFSINKKLKGKTLYLENGGAAPGGNNQYYLFVHTDAANDLIEEAHDIRVFFKDSQ